METTRGTEGRTGMLGEERTAGKGEGGRNLEGAWIEIREARGTSLFSDLISWRGYILPRVTEAPGGGEGTKGDEEITAAGGVRGKYTADGAWGSSLFQGLLYPGSLARRRPFSKGVRKKGGYQRRPKLLYNRRKKRDRHQKKEDQKKGS